MEEKNPQTTSQPEKVQKSKPGFFKNWVNSLLGKKMQSTVVTKPAPTQEPEVKPQEEDSISEDIEHLKTFVHHTEEKLSPFVEKGKGKSEKVFTSAVKVVDTSLLRKLVSFLMILIFFGAAVFVFSRFYHTVNQNGGGGEIIESEVSPTGINYQTTNPSVWAEDPQVLKLEEEVNTLEREVSNSFIKETNLNPPTLDYNISF